MNTENVCFTHASSSCMDSVKVWLGKLLKNLEPDMAVSSRKGSDGRPVNQDAVMLTRGRIPRIGVADGISNSNQGQIASKLAFIPFLLAPATSTKGLSKLAVISHALVCEIYRMFGQTKVGGTTLVVAELHRGAVATLLSIGDSRAWLLTPRGLFRRRFVCRQITVDQVYGELKKRRRIENQERFPDHVMFQSIGSGLIESEVVPQRVIIPAGGMLVLATDGLFQKMDDVCAEIAAVASEVSLSGAEMLVEALVQRAVDLESTDDISVAVLLPSYLLGARWPFWSAFLVAVLTGGLLS